MRSISRLLAVLRFELVRRRRLLLGGVLAGLLAPLLAWATGAPLGVLAASLGLAVAAGTGLLLGIHAFVPEQLDGRLAFLLLQPLPAASIPLARGLTASLIGIGQYLLALLPTLALADFATTDASVPFEVLVLGAAAVPAAVFLGSLLPMVLGTRDRWTVLDLAAMAFVTVVLLGLAPSLDSLGLEAVFGLAAIGVVFLALLGAAWGLVAAVSRGRIDARRGHRAFTARLASALLVALAAASLFLAWASSPNSGALAVGSEAQTATGNTWIAPPLLSPCWHEGPELLRQGYERSHAFPVAGGKGVALPGEARRAVPLADSSSVVWLADGALHVLDLETGQRSRAAWPSGDPRASSPSPDGRRIAALFSSRDEHGVPRWSAEVRSVDDPVVGHRLELEGVARLDGEARVEWLEHGPRFTVAQEEGLAWFDLPVASDAERPDREMAATGRAGRIDFPSLLRPWGGEPGVLHELSGERSALSTPDEIVVVDRLGDVLWRLPSLRLGGLGPIPPAPRGGSAARRGGATTCCGCPWRGLARAAPSSSTRRATERP